MTNNFFGNNNNIIIIQYNINNKAIDDKPDDDKSKKQKKRWHERVASFFKFVKSVYTDIKGLWAWLPSLPAIVSFIREHFF